MAAVHAGSGHTSPSPRPQAQIQPCRYKTGKTLGAGSYSVVKECVHIDTGRYYAAKVINKRLMAGREHMVCEHFILRHTERLREDELEVSAIEVFMLTGSQLTGPK